MLSIIRPSESTIASTLERLKSVPLNGTFAGCLDGEIPAGFKLDRHRVWLGTGQSAWNAAVEAMNHWQVMPSTMVTIHGTGPIEAGRIVGVLFRGLGIWSFNPCRILKVIDFHEGDLTQYGFVYATLPGHVEAGEEQFRLVWNHTDDQVWYDIKVMSRPKHPLAWLAYPYSRYQQRRFRQLSAASMLQAVIRKSTVTAGVGTGS